MSWASDKARETACWWADHDVTVQDAIERAIRETLAEAVKAVEDAGGDNEDYHAAAIRKLGES